MANKKMNTRIIHKHETQANWEQATGFQPLKAELIVYDPDETNKEPRIKIGDGIRNVNELPFIGNIIYWQEF